MAEGRTKHIFVVSQSYPQKQIPIHFNYKGTNSHFDIGHSVFDIRYSNALCLLIPCYADHLLRQAQQKNGDCVTAFRYPRIVISSAAERSGHRLYGFLLRRIGFTSSDRVIAQVEMLFPATLTLVHIRVVFNDLFGSLIFLFRHLSSACSFIIQSDYVEGLPMVIIFSKYFDQLGEVVNRPT